MTQVRKRSTFLGPQHAFYQQADWPAPCRYHLQIYDVLPGALWNPAFEAQLYQPKILLPTGMWNHWRLIDAPFFFLYKQRLDDIKIHVDYFFPPRTFFRCKLHLGVTTFARNQLLDPVDQFAYDGYATLSREDL